MNPNSFENRHIGASSDDVENMLNFIGLDSIDQLIKQTIPNSILKKEELNIKSAKFFGISYRGLAISEFPYQYENQVDTLTLINAPTKFLDLKNLEKFLIKEGIKSVYDFFIPSDYKGLKEQFRLAYHKRSWLPDFIAKSLYLELCKPYVNGWTEIVDDLINNASELQNRDYEFDIPTTLIWGKADRIIPVEIGTSLNNYFRNSTLHLIDKCGHLPTIEKPKQFLNIVIKNVLQQDV